MNTFRTAFTTFAASLVLHAGVVYSLHVETPDAPKAAIQPVAISYMKLDVGKPPVISPTAMPVPPKKISDSVSTFKPKSLPLVVPKKAPSNPSVGNTRAQAVSQKSDKETLPKTSSEILADPKKSKIFVNYFGLVKEKIHTVLRRKYDAANGALGSVSVIFVLNADGSLEDVKVLEVPAPPEPFLKALAAECLKEAAPFAAFPRDLGSRRIAFNLTIFFDSP